MMTFKRPMKRSQLNCRAYCASSIELERVPQLVRSLCDLIDEVETDTSAPGRNSLSRREAIFGAVMTIYSGRRERSDLRACVERGYLSRAWERHTLLRALKAPTTTEILTRMIEHSAGPLAEIENRAGQFALGSTYGDPWFDQGLLVMIGTATNAVTSAKVGPLVGCTVLPELLAATAKRFKVKGVSADSGYLSEVNLEAIDNVGAVPFIPFHERHLRTANRSIPWRRMLGHFLFENEDFRRRCMRRAEVEATLSAVKALAGGSLRSKLPVARANEVLVLVLLHTLTCICRAIEESGIEVNLGPWRAWEKR